MTLQNVIKKLTFDTYFHRTQFHSYSFCIVTTLWSYGRYNVYTYGNTNLLHDL